MNAILIPLVPQQHVKNNYLHQLDAWRNFAQRITKNPFVKEFLLQRDGHTCAWCNNELKENFQVHHICYQHSCSYGARIKLSYPTKNRLDKIRTVPDCENCKKENESRFMTCMNKLVLVHGLCNKEIAQTNPRSAKQTIG